jgi:hypothetical protein
MSAWIGQLGEQSRVRLVNLHGVDCFLFASSIETSGSMESLISDWSCGLESLMRFPCGYLCVYLLRLGD